jgi:hypothetical protein
MYCCSGKAMLRLGTYGCTSLAKQMQLTPCMEGLTRGYISLVVVLQLYCTVICCSTRADSQILWALHDEIENCMVSIPSALLIKQVMAAVILPCLYTRALQCL